MGGEIQVSVNWNTNSSDSRGERYLCKMKRMDDWRGKRVFGEDNRIEIMEILRDSEFNENQSLISLIQFSICVK